MQFLRASQVGNHCEQQITIGESLSSNQLLGLNLVSKLAGGRDVVFAVDLTESVNLDSEGRLRLKQIISDSLNKGDSVYIVPFSSQVNPTNPDINPLSLTNAIAFNNSKQDIEKIIEQIPLKANLNEKNTDIQQAEHFIYENLAQINQNRLCNNQPIKPQSVVWLTDAPLNSDVGITSDVWIETPANSPYRDTNSPESIARKQWLENLPINIRSLNIDNYKLSVSDIQPTIQEFCTPAPGGKQTCIVNSYLIGQLWLPTVIGGLILTGILGGCIFAYNYCRSLRQVWKLEIQQGEDDEDKQICYLSNKKSLTIGEEIECLGGEIRGYLKREGNKLIIESTNTLAIFYREKEVRQPQIISNNIIRLNCPYQNQDHDITIKISR